MMVLKQLLITRSIRKYGLIKQWKTILFGKSNVKLQDLF